MDLQDINFENGPAKGEGSTLGGAGGFSSIVPGPAGKGPFFSAKPPTVDLLPLSICGCCFIK